MTSWTLGENPSWKLTERATLGQVGESNSEDDANAVRAGGGGNLALDVPTVGEGGLGKGRIRQRRHVDLSRRVVLDNSGITERLAR